MSERLDVEQSKTLAPGPFWLDGGYDRDLVEACRYHPVHRWIVLRLGDVLAPAAFRDPDELMVICQGCYVPRCGHTNDPDPCILPRHHRELHLASSGALEDDGVWPGNEKPSPPEIARMRAEMWSQFAPDTEMPAVSKRPKGRIVEGDEL